MHRGRSAQGERSGRSKLGIVGCGEVDGGTQRKDAALGGEEESAADLMRNAAYR